MFSEEDQETAKEPVFEIATCDTFLHRFVLLIWTLPEVFLSGFVWQGFGMACGCDSTSTSYFFLTGFGGALGAMIGHLLFRITLENGMPTIPRRARNKSLANFVAMFLGSATVWQKVANDTHNLGMNFTQAFFFVWIVSFTIFLTTLTVLRGVNGLFKHYWKLDNDMGTIMTRFYYDVQLSISVSLADAFYLATVSGFYTDNTLGGIFGTTSNTPAFESMMKSGTVAIVGFSIAQIAQNAIIKHCWLDRPASKVPDNKVPLVI